ncbi:mycothiol synthase [Pseudokineococcus basanitobsidens]|uniref:Mycothiol acetyltransferase n=1 Tax=Pseudokineococcus basanitobsidens TaxID=1926649 RepID=A0ABU8RNH5_9ACTN
MPVPETSGAVDPPAAPPPSSRPPLVLSRAERLGPEQVDAVLALVDAAERVDGTPPVSEQALIRLREGAQGQHHLLAHEGRPGVDGAEGRGADQDGADQGEVGRLVGYGSLVAAAADDAGEDPEDGPEDGTGPRPAALVGELVVAPDARGRGTGRALVEAALEDRGGRTLRLWMHGDAPAARSLADRTGMRRVRELWTMRADLTDPLPALPAVPGTRVRAFRPGHDEQAWLRLNGRAFAEHPEQGAWTSDDVLAREREPWFDAEGLLLVESTTSGELLASHWTKTTTAPDGSTLGEVYVVAVDPSAQGRGLGRLVTLAGLHHLRERGVRDVDLYVESDNAPAVATYRRLGFERSGADVLVEAPAPSSDAPPGGRR